MKKLRIILALVLAALMLCGCSMLPGLLGGMTMTRYQDMEYTRPDLGEMERALEAAIAASQTEPLEDVLDAIYRFYDEYDW